MRKFIAFEVVVALLIIANCAYILALLLGACTIPKTQQAKTPDLYRAPMVLIPAGEFKMTMAAGQVSIVCLDAFYMDIFE